MDVAYLAHAGEVAEWDDYVAKHPGETNYHQSGWKSVVERGCGHKTHYLYAGAGKKSSDFGLW